MVYLNQTQRVLHPIQVKWSYRVIDEFHLPDGYDKKVYTVGSGTFGSVIRTKATTNRVDERRNRIMIEVAVKKFKKTVEHPRAAQICYRELKLLQHLDHPNIAQILDLYTPSKNAHELDLIYLVMEYAGSTIAKQLTQSATDNYVYLPMKIIPRIIRDSLRALKYLKAADVLHRDLKPDNLAIDKSGKAVLIDFGLARTGRETNKSVELTDGAGTPAYSAPEVTFWRGGSYGREADIWSVGCILAALLSWHHLFNDQKSKVTLYTKLIGQIPSSFMKKVYDPTAKTYMESKNAIVPVTADLTQLKEYFSTSKVVKLNDPRIDQALNFLKGCLQYDIATRLTIEQALEHDFLADIGPPEGAYSVQPLIYDDSDRDIDDWKCVLYSEIKNFEARQDTLRP